MKLFKRFDICQNTDQNPCGNCVHESLSLLCPTSLWTLNHVSMPALQTIMLQCPYSIPLTVGSSLKVSMLFSSSLSHCWICCFWQLSLGLRIFFKLKPKSEHLEPTHCVCNSAQSTRRLLYVSIRHLWMVLSYHCVAMIRSNNQKSHYPGEQDFMSKVSTSSPFKVKQIARVWFLKILHKVASRWCDP